VVQRPFNLHSEQVGITRNNSEELRGRRRGDGPGVGGPGRGGAKWETKWRTKWPNNGPGGGGGGSTLVEPSQRHTLHFTEGF
jgi:hypothetical protein